MKIDRKYQNASTLQSIYGIIILRKVVKKNTVN